MQASTAAAGTNRVDAAGPLSLRWLGVDFRALLPWKLRSLTLEYGAADDLLPFVARHHAALFGSVDDHRWHTETVDARKRRFIEETDIFLIRAENGDLVGNLVGHPLDWSTYYIRSMALLPEYRGRGTYPELMDRIAETLCAAGVERMEADVTPTNRMNMVTGLRLGYVATGTFNSDRWGSVIRMTRFLNEKAEDVFHDQFCAGAWPRRRLTTNAGPERRPQ